MSTSDSDSPSAPQERQRTDSASTSSSQLSHRSGATPSLGEQLGGGTPAADDLSGSERSHASPPSQARRRLVDSSSDDEQPSQKAAQGDVFGEELSSDSDNAEGDVRKREDSEDEGIKTEVVQSQFDEQEEQQEEELPPKTLNVDFVRVNFSLGENLYHVRMPNFLSIETRPFDPEEYEDVCDENDVMDEEGRNRLKLKVENTLRWRQTPIENGLKYESNAKIVKWSDGTMSLMVGNEVFDCHTTHLLAPTHLYVRQTQGLCAKGIFGQRMKFRPSTTDSKTHKKVTMNMADRTKKSGQVKFIEEIGSNPDTAKKEIIRREEEALRAAYRRERDLTSRRGGRDIGRGRISSGFLEDRGDYSEDESPKRGRVRREAPLIGASSDESEDEAKKIEKSKEDSSDSDEEFRRNKQEKKKKIVSSDEEDN